MQASIMANPADQSVSPQQGGQEAPMPPVQPIAQAQPPEIYPPQEQPGAEAYPPQGSPEEAPQDDYYTQQPQAYDGQDYYAPQGGTDTETISEIAEQVVTEKLEDYKSKVGDIASFKNQMQNQVNDIDDRLKRIENSIQQLQNAILGKIGEFGESSAMIHKDLDNLHGTVAKLMNPLIDNVNEMKKLKKIILS